MFQELFYLNQLFYIGDGHSGYNNPTGASLYFTAPTGATRLYLGIIDSDDQGGLPWCYSDNLGSFSVDVSLSVSPVPEPETYALMLFGLAVVGAAARRRKSGS